MSRWTSIAASVIRESGLTIIELELASRHLVTLPDFVDAHLAAATLAQLDILLGNVADIYSI